MSGAAPGGDLPPWLQGPGTPRSGASPHAASAALAGTPPTPRSGRSHASVHNAGWPAASGFDSGLAKGNQDLERLSVEQLRMVLADMEVDVERLRSQLHALRHEPHEWEKRLKHLEEAVQAAKQPPREEGARKLLEDSSDDESTSSREQERQQEDDMSMAVSGGPPGFALGRDYMPLDLLPPPHRHYAGHMARPMESVDVVIVGPGGPHRHGEAPEAMPSAVETLSRSGAPRPGAVKRFPLAPPPPDQGFFLDPYVRAAKVPDATLDPRENLAPPPAQDSWVSWLGATLRENVQEIAEDMGGGGNKAVPLAEETVPPEVFDGDRAGTEEDRLPHDWKGEEAAWRKHYFDSLGLTPTLH